VAVALHTSNGHSYIVDYAKAFAVVCKSVVKASANVKAAVITQSVLGGDNRATGLVPKSLHQFFAVRNLKFKFLARAECSVL
jgi:hypothetical protein